MNTSRSPRRRRNPSGPYEEGKKYHGAVPEVRYLPISVIYRAEYDHLPETLRVSARVAEQMDFSEPVDVTAHRFPSSGWASVSPPRMRRPVDESDDAAPEVILRDGHHRLAAAVQTGREWLPVSLTAINAKGEKLNALAALSRDIEARLARKNPRRRKNGLLGALVVGGLGFAAGAYVEHERPFVAKAKDRLRGPTKVAREQAARLQREVFTPAPAKRVSAPAPAKRTATTDPAWRRERSPDGKGYAHLRTINGVEYEVFERIYSDGSKAIHLEAGDKRDRIYAPNGEEDGWVSVAAAKKAAEADAKTRKNPRRRK